MDSDGGYSTVRHEMIFSEAANLLSPGGFVRLVEFICHWWRESNYGKRENVPVHFTFLSSSRFESRATWIPHRKELEEKGFICNHNKLLGTWELGMAWRCYEASAVELERMKKHGKLKETRSQKTTAKYRVPEMQKNSQDSEKRSVPKIGGGRESENATQPVPKIVHSPCRKLDPYRSINHHPLPPTTKTPTPETPTPEASTSENPRVLQLPKRFVTLNLLEYSVWPPPASALRDAQSLLAWSEAVLETGLGRRWEQWGTEEDAEARRLHAALEARDAQRFQESVAAESPLDKLVETCDGDESKLTVAVAAHLGDASDYAVDRVRRVYNLVGPEALIRGAKTLLNDPSAPDADKRLKFLKHRATMTQLDDMH
jgi:hypothetical protein